MDGLNKLQGDLDTLHLEQKVLNATLFVSWVISVVILIEVIILEPSWQPATLAFIAAATFSGLHLISIKKPNTDWIVWAYLTSQYAIIFIDWLFIGGNTGIALPLFLALGAMMPVITKQNQLIKGYLSLALLFTVLVYCAAIFPEHLPQQPFTLVRVSAQLVEISVLVIGLGLITNLAIKSFRVQKQKNEQLNRKLEKMAHMDGLTQLANRRQFDHCLNLEWKRHLRQYSSLSLILCDIDYLKQINDTYGHLIGDDCIKLIAKTIKKVVKRPTDLIARYGGDEFVILLPDTDLEGAKKVADQIEEAIVSAKIGHTTTCNKKLVTISTGVYSTVPTTEVSPEFLIDCADRELYTAKKCRKDNDTYNEPISALG